MFINNFDPVALEIFSLEIRWYSLAYIFGIILGWILAKKLFIQDIEVKNKFDDYLTYLNYLRVEVELIRKSIMNFTEIIPINQDVVSSAEEDLKLAQERYSIGSATILEVLDAQVSLIRSNSTLINTIHDARMQEMSLKALLGILDLEYQTKEK